MLKTVIPFADMRGKTPVDLLRRYPDKAQAIITASRKTYGPLSQAVSALALPLADRWSRRWLKRTRNPYLPEIESFVDILDVPGVVTLNVAYEWGCTSGVYPTDDTVTLLRLLDWPFPALGRHVMITLQDGAAGAFYNVTWPGMSGVLTAMAPGRFSAAINQAPMRRHGYGFAGDWARNRFAMRKAEGLPPTHLLRQAFERAGSYDEAKRMLAETPVALPVIFILAGVRPGEGCIIERLEGEAHIIELGGEQRVCAANHFLSGFHQRGKGWRPRALDSEGRYRQGASIHGHDLNENHFGWLRAPMVNPLTRLAVMADAGTARLVVQGFEGIAEATAVFNLPASVHDQRQAV